PPLYLVGSQSPASAREVARLLTKSLPDVTTVEIEGAGHMAPITHPDVVDAAIEAHIAGRMTNGRVPRGRLLEGRT
ncbi:MAG: alpha/beta fold hydrolase, partial [Trebonia sp.]